MKKIIPAIVLACAIALPIAGTSTADPWYHVKPSAKVSGKNLYGLALWSGVGGKGSIRCVVPIYEIVHRDWGQNKSRWIHVRWNKGGSLVWGAPEWKYKDARGKWCSERNRHGWVHKNQIKSKKYPPRWAGWTPPDNIRWYIVKHQTSVFNIPSTGPRQNARIERCGVEQGREIERTSWPDEEDWTPVFGHGACNGWISKNDIYNAFTTVSHLDLYGRTNPKSAEIPVFPSVNKLWESKLAALGNNSPASAQMGMICGLNLGTQVRVHKDYLDDTAEIEVLNGNCKGKRGWIWAPALKR